MSFLKANGNNVFRISFTGLDIHRFFQLMSKLSRYFGTVSGLKVTAEDLVRVQFGVLVNMLYDINSLSLCP